LDAGLAREGRKISSSWSKKMLWELERLPFISVGTGETAIDSSAWGLERLPFTSVGTGKIAIDSSAWGLEKLPFISVGTGKIAIHQRGNWKDCH
jgi:hypothetical protein